MGRALSLVRRNPDFRRLLIAQLVVFGGDWFLMIPLLALLSALTGGGAWGGIVLAVDTSVIAVLLPYAGTLADRLDRRMLLIGGNVASVGAALLLLFVRSAATAWLALAAIVAIAAAKALYYPAAQAALPNLVDREDLPTANAIAGSAWGTMLVVGASLGGLIASLVGPYPSFGIGAVCLALAAVITVRVRRPLQSEGHGAEPLKASAALRQALRHIASHPRVRALVTVKSAVGFGNGVLAAFPILATSVFGAGAFGIGLLYGARGLGALIGPLLLRAVLASPSRLLPGLAISMGTYGVCYLLVGVAPWFWLVLLLVVVAHMAGGGNWVMSNYALQTEVPDSLRGRVFAADMMIAMAAVSLSQAAAGVFTDRFGPQVVIGVCGSATLVYAIVWRVATMRLLRDPGKPGDPDAT
ncbi:MAG: MFS transporter [Micromonosporaceae bacterium]|nr:MFS transporter [Micromonosporaceae bacterium]